MTTLKKTFLKLLLVLLVVQLLLQDKKYKNKIVGMQLIIILITD